MASSNLLGLRGNAASIPRLEAVSEILLLNKRSSTAARIILVTFASLLWLGKLAHSTRGRCGILYG